MRRDDGFSLLEVLVAFAIAGLALTAILRSYAGAASTSASAADRLAAVEIAEDRLDRLLAEAPEPGTTLGPVVERGLVWRAHVEPAGPGAALLRLRVSVAAAEGSAPLVDLVTLRRLPEPGTRRGR